MHTQLLMLSVNDTESPSVLKQLMDIVKTQLGGGGSVTTLCDLLGVMVGLYSLVGEGCADERSEEREAKVRGGGTLILERYILRLFPLAGSSGRADSQAQRLRCRVLSCSGHW